MKARRSGWIKTEPHKREAQKALAEAVVRDLHGEEELQKALNITNALFKGNIKDLTVDEVHDALQGFDHLKVNDNLPLVEVLVEAGIASSKREAREWIKQGSIQINGDKIVDAEAVISSEGALSGRLSLVKRGKKNYYVIEQ